MTLEAIRPFKLRLHGRVQSFSQGQAIELENEDAERLLQKAPDRVRRVGPTLAHLVTLESVEGLKPIYWESADGRIVGPGHVHYVTQDGSELWMCIEHANFMCWVRDHLLRSRQAFEQQKHWVCSCCQGTDFWTSKYRASICRVCHPPAAGPVVEGETKELFK